MNTVLTVLGVTVAAILLGIFGLGAVAAVAHSFFRFLKGVFRIGFEVTKCCMTIALLPLMSQPQNAIKVNHSGDSSIYHSGRSFIFIPAVVSFTFQP